MSAKKHILVVEDEPHLADGIKYNLEAEGYRVTATGDGPSALNVIEQDPEAVDLVVLDIMLPGMSGYAVCEALRSGGNGTPILILSARTLPEDRTRGFDVGANQYLTKPFELDELLSRVKNLLTMHAGKGLSQGPSSKIETFTFGQAQINFLTHEVRVADKTVRMTPLELKLLRYFVENQNRVVSRNELLEHVWDMPGNVTTRAVDQFIRRLRKIFEPDPAAPRYFLTLRDAGYRFVPRPSEQD